MRSRGYATLSKSIYEMPGELEKYRAEQELKIRTEFTAPQQLALMMLLRSDLSKLIVRKLYHSTVRVGVADFEALVSLAMAQRKPYGRGHQLSPLGRYKAQALSFRLADDLEIKLPQRPPTQALPRRRKPLLGMSEWGNA